ncbi:MAG: MFS transporter [Promethearchaeia archaeon]
MSKKSEKKNSQEKDSLPKEHIPLKLKINFGFGAMANALLQGLVYANITFYYVEKVGASPGLIGIAWLLFGVWNVINDPIASYFIDNTRTEIGRRIPFIRYGSVFYGLAFIFCWFPIWHTPWGLFFNFILALFFLDTMFTIVGCCFFCLPNEIALTAQGRAELSFFSSLFNFVAVGLGFAIPILFLTGQNGIHPFFLPLMVIIGVGGAITLYLTSFGLKENMFAQMQEKEGFIEGLKLTLKNKAFWIFMIPAFCIALVLPVLQTGILYYIDYIIVGQNVAYLIVSLMCGVILGFIITLNKVDDWGPKKLMILILSMISFGFILLFFIGFSALLAAIPGFILGIGLSSALILNTVIMGDVIDNDELITGKRREAIYGGVNAIVTKYPISIANWLFLSVIVAFGFRSPEIIGEVSYQQPQTDLALMGIMVAFCLIPGIFLGISAIAMKFYPLAGEEWTQKKKKLMKIHEQKEREYLKKLKKQGRLRAPDSG